MAMFSPKMLRVSAVGLLIIVLVGVLFDKLEVPQHIAQPSEHSEQIKISYLDILENPEFKQKMRQAILSDDVETMQMLQNRAIEIANVAGLSADQTSLLVGERGLHFIAFRVQRQIFADKFSEHYIQLKSIEQLKRQYPQAQDLFARADQLIQVRDQSIKDIAIALSSGDNYQAHLAQAQQQWLARANQPQIAVE